MVQERGQGLGAGQKCGCGRGGGGAGKGPKGTCVCSACGHQVPHEAGVPCREVKCSQCGGAMTRRD